MHYTYKFVDDRTSRIFDMAIEGHLLQNCYPVPKTKLVKIEAVIDIDMTITCGLL